VSDRELRQTEDSNENATVFGAGSLLLLLYAPLAIADTVVVPSTVATFEGNDANFGPFFDNSVRYQQVYSAS
jgi:hypothetical protein